MKKLKVLNLYAGIGGNRKLWPSDGIEVTAVEIDPKIAEIYKDFFPNDNVIVADAHQYLLDHSHEFDFIWSSPPCPTHSGCNHFLNAQGVIRYPDMSLWQEILFLKTFFKGKYVVENVIPYYEPFIKAQIADRHSFWANFVIPNFKIGEQISIRNAKASTRRDKQFYLVSLQNYHKIDLSRYTHINKTLLLANCVNPRLGLHIFKMAFKERQTTL